MEIGSAYKIDYAGKTFIGLLFDMDESFCRFLYVTSPSFKSDITIKKDAFTYKKLE